MTTSVVVTGGARGIGRGIAEQLVARGHRVVIGDLDAGAAAATAAEVGAVAGLAMDVRDPGRAPCRRRGGGAARTARGVVQQRRRRRRRHARGAVRRAGTPARRGQPARHDVGHPRRARGLRRRRAATSSTSPRSPGSAPVPGYSVYAATKAGVVSLSASVNAEAPRGVRVHALCPDGADTAMLAAQDPDGLGLAAGALRRRRSSPSSRSPRRPSTSSARDGWCGRCRPGAGEWCVVRRWPRALTQHAVGLFAAQGRRAMRRR